VPIEEEEEEKAYDIVPLKKLWKALEHYDISNSIIRALKRLYANSFSKIKKWKQLSSGFYVAKDYDKVVVYRLLCLRYIYRRL
jgi:hypothetical protein